MASSTPAPSAVTISSLPSGNSTADSIILETVLDESTMEAAEAVVALGSDLKQQQQPNLRRSRRQQFCQRYLQSSSESKEDLMKKLAKKPAKKPAKKKTKSSV
eukprot:14410131-Ditylum_brightwellii.AAC.1